MLFNSLHFLLFFPLVTLGYFLVPPRWRWLHLVVASAYFYMAFVPYYVLILCFVILVDWVSGLLIERASGRRRLAFLCASLATNVSLLCVFKYFNFLSDNLSVVANALGHREHLPLLEIALPIGLSFHTFQSMSYAIEVYRGAVPAERHLGYFALYVLYYPQLVAGPIERPQNLLHQFHAEHSFDARRAVSGLRLMMWGMLKKVVVADRLAELVNQIYEHPRQFPAPALALAAYAFSFQIYCDFSGYSDIARGASRVMGVELMVNFRQPYFAQSMGEFWRRWHISLSTWFRDYVYVPLGGNRVSPWRRARNLMIVFLLSGLWHGASWLFVIWGGLHGLFVAAGALRGPRTESRGLLRFGRILVTFHLVTLAWVFFRAKTLGDAWHVVTHVIGPWGGGLAAAGLSTGRVASLGALVGLLLGVDWAIDNKRLVPWFDARPRWQRWGLYYGAIATMVFLGSSASIQFIYFQF